MTDAVQKTGSVAKDAGMSYEQLMAITGKTSERTRMDGSTIGNAMKTILVRISKASKLSGNGLVDNTQLSDASKALSSVGIDVYTRKGKFRNINTILGELAAKWNHLSDAQQKQISFAVAATRQTNVLSAILDSFTESQKLATNATKTRGNAERNNQKWMKSSAGLITSMKTDVSTFWVNFFNGTATKAVLTMAKGFTDIGATISRIPVIGGVLAGGGGIAAIINRVIRGKQAYKSIKSDLIDPNGVGLGKSLFYNLFDPTSHEGSRADSVLRKDIARTGSVFRGIGNISNKILEGIIGTESLNNLKDKISKFADNHGWANKIRKFNNKLPRTEREQARAFSGAQKYAEKNGFEITKKNGEYIRRDPYTTFEAADDGRALRRTAFKETKVNAGELEKMANASMAAESSIGVIGKLSQKMSNIKANGLKASLSGVGSALGSFIASPAGGIAAAIAALASTFAIIKHFADKPFKDYQNAVSDEAQTKQNISSAKAKVKKYNQQKKDYGYLNTYDSTQLTRAKNELDRNKRHLSISRQRQANNINSAFSISKKDLKNSGVKGVDYLATYSSKYDRKGLVGLQNAIGSLDELNKQQKKGTIGLDAYNKKSDAFVGSLDKWVNKVDKLKKEGASIPKQAQQLYEAAQIQLKAYDDINKKIEQKTKLTPEQKYQKSLNDLTHQTHGLAAKWENSATTASSFAKTVKGIATEGSGLQTYQKTISNAIKDASGTVNGTRLFWGTAQGILRKSYLDKIGYNFNTAYGKVQRLSQLSAMNKVGAGKFEALLLKNATAINKLTGGRKNGVRISLEGGQFKIKGLTASKMSGVASALGISTDFANALMDNMKRYVKFSWGSQKDIDKDLSKMGSSTYNENWRSAESKGRQKAFLKSNKGKHSYVAADDYALQDLPQWVQNDRAKAYKNHKAHTYYDIAYGTNQKVAGKGNLTYSQLAYRNLRGESFAEFGRTNTNAPIYRKNGHDVLNMTKLSADMFNKGYSVNDITEAYINAIKNGKKTSVITNANGKKTKQINEAIKKGDYASARKGIKAVVKDQKSASTVNVSGKTVIVKGKTKGDGDGKGDGGKDGSDGKGGSGGKDGKGGSGSKGGKNPKPNANNTYIDKLGNIHTFPKAKSSYATKGGSGGSGGKNPKPNANNTYIDRLGNTHTISASKGKASGGGSIWSRIKSMFAPTKSSKKLFKTPRMWQWGKKKPIGLSSGSKKTGTDNTKTKIRTKTKVDVDTKDAQKKLNSLGKKGKSKNNKIKVNADTKGAVSKLKKITSAFKKLKSGKTAKIKVTAHTGNTVSKLNKVKKAFSSLKKKKTAKIKVTAHTGSAISGLRKVKSTVNSLKKSRARIRITANTGSALSKIRQVKSRLTSLGKKKVTPKVNVGGNALSKAKAIKSAINSIHGKTVTINIETKKTEKAGGGYSNGGLTTTGELGQELVRTTDNQFYTVGDHGREDVFLNRGDYVYTAAKTREILSGRKFITRSNDLTEDATKGISPTLTKASSQISSAFNSVYKRYADGGESKSGWALTGEEGVELVQTKDKAYFVGKNGAEFTYLNKGDFVYNADQTKDIVRRSNSPLTSGNPFEARRRGTDPAASGSGASLIGYTGKKATVHVTVKTSGKGKSHSSRRRSSGGRSSRRSSGGRSSRRSSRKKSSKKGSSGKGKSGSDPTRFDWIERAVNKIEHTLTMVEKHVESIHRSWNARDKSITHEIKIINREIGLQRYAAKWYKQKAVFVSVPKMVYAKDKKGKKIPLKKNGKVVKKNGKIQYKKVQATKKVTVKKKVPKKYTSGKKKGQIVKKNGKTVYTTKKVTTKKKVYTQKGGLTYTNSKGKKVKLDKKWQKLVVNGAIKSINKKTGKITYIKGNKIQAVKDEKLANAISRAQDYIDKSRAAQEKVEDLKIQKLDAYKQKFDNVVANYQNQQTAIAHKSTMYSKYNDRIETQGRLASMYNYKMALKEEELKKKNIEAEIKLLRQRMKEYLAHGGNKKSQAYQEMTNSLNGTKEALEDSKNQVVSLQENLIEGMWKVFDRAFENFNTIPTELQFVIDNIAKDGSLYNELNHYYDSDIAQGRNVSQQMHEYANIGKLNDFGIATGGLKLAKYEAYMEQAKKLNEQLKAVKAQLDADPYNQNIRSQYEKYLEIYQNAVTSANEEKEAIKSLVADGYQKQLEAIQKIIDARKESLQAAKDLYDYEESMKDKQKSINSYQKQLLALQGDNSEEAQARRQTIQKNLDDAKKDMKSTQYSQMVSDQGAMLDELYSRLSEITDKISDDVDRSLEELKVQVARANTSIPNTINAETEKWGYTLSDNGKSIVDALGTNGVISSTIGSVLSDSTNKIESLLESIFTKLQELANNAGDTKKEAVNAENLGWASLQKKMKDKNGNLLVRHKTNEHGYKDISKEYSALEENAAKEGWTEETISMYDQLADAAAANDKTHDMRVKGRKNIAAYVKKVKTSSKTKKDKATLSTAKKNVKSFQKKYDKYSKQVTNINKEIKKANAKGDKRRTAQLKAQLHTVNNQKKAAKQDLKHYKKVEEKAQKLVDKDMKPVVNINNIMQQNGAVADRLITDAASGKAQWDKVTSKGYNPTHTTSSSSSSKKSSSSSRSSSKWKAPSKLSGIPHGKTNNKYKNAKTIHDMLRYRGYDAGGKGNQFRTIAARILGHAYKGTAAENKKIRDYLKKHGFAKGGTIGDLIKSTGEDGFVLARTGEEVLSIPKLKIADEMVSKLINTSTMIPNTLNRVPTNTSVGNINFTVEQMNLPNVKDSKEFAENFVDALKDDRIQKAIRSVSVDMLNGGNSFSVKRF